ncbi:MAG TPA: glycosyltransferase [Mycobacteriales bacterium]|jgi:GT2 family glycosyltransferase|nr:glycosyltransferase [Mycobacteriales bacterium]
MTDIGCVVLTMGNRPELLDRALQSILSQRGVSVDVVVVGNGWQPTGLPPQVRGVGLPRNVGIPAGRNAGVPHVAGELLFFLDDDAALSGDDVLAKGARLLAERRDIGVVQLRPVDPVTGRTPRSFVPRLRVGDPARDSDLTALWEGAVLVRREVLAAAGGWPEVYFYQHEGVELAWRVIDEGHRVHYAGDLVCWHDAKQPGRDPSYFRMQGRNRVWLARRNLPLPLAAAYLCTWLALTVARVRGRAALGQALRGWVDGFREPCGERRPVSWRAAWRMTRAGRPPVI